jgi:hypothetical protein
VKCQADPSGPRDGLWLPKENKSQSNPGFSGQDEAAGRCIWLLRASRTADAKVKTDE